VLDARACPMNEQERRFQEPVALLSLSGNGLRPVVATPVHICMYVSAFVEVLLQKLLSSVDVAGITFL
jgi:hypothetical protein